MATIEELKGDAPQSNPASEGLRALAKILGLRDDFLIDLFFDPNDWSFVVKAHALLESVICTLLAMHLRKQELEAVFAEEVEMKARIEVTKALGITTSADRKAMLALGRLRNKLVHNAKDTSFTFEEFFKNKDQRKNFSETFGHGWSDPVGGTEPPVSRPDYVTANPKFAVFVSVHMIAMYVVREFSKIQTETAVEALRSTATPGEGAAAPAPEVK